MLITALMKIITTVARYENVTSLTITSESMATIRIAVIVTMFKIKRENVFKTSICYDSNNTGEKRRL